MPPLPRGLAGLPLAISVPLSEHLDPLQLPLTVLDKPAGKQTASLNPVRVFKWRGVPRAMKLSFKRKCYHCKLYGVNQSVAEYLVSRALSRDPAERRPAQAELPSRRPGVAHAPPALSEPHGGAVHELAPRCKTLPWGAKICSGV